MDFNEYQLETTRTSNADGFDLGNFEGKLAAFALGLTGEAGEVADTIKKVLFHKHPLDRDALNKEIGDVLWYLAALADTLGLGLDQAAQDNIEKLRKRYPNGFNPEDSLKRVDTVSNLLWKVEVSNAGSKRKVAGGLSQGAAEWIADELRGDESREPTSIVSVTPDDA